MVAPLVVATVGGTCCFDWALADFDQGREQGSNEAGTGGKSCDQRGNSKRELDRLLGD